VSDSQPLREDAPDLDLLSGRIAVPLVFGGFLLAAGPLLWVGTHGSSGSLLVLYYGGILSIVVGFVLAFIVGLFALSSLILAGALWITLERIALAAGAPFGWAAPALAVLGVLALAVTYRPLRETLDRRRAFERLSGGSVPPPPPAYRIGPR
jgi:hypothetical protein